MYQKIYVYLRGCKKGFKEGCRPLIRLYGCYLTGVYEGQLLTALGIYANNETWVSSGGDGDNGLLYLVP